MYAEALLGGLEKGAVVIADKGYDASGAKAQSPTSRTNPTASDDTVGRRPSIANATTSSASSTS